MFTIIKTSSNAESFNISINKQELAIAKKQVTIVTKSIFNGIREGYAIAKETYNTLNK